MPKRSPEHLERRREQILDGARRCFARYGFEGATVVRLEAEIGLSRGAIFHYFPNKDALFIALAERDSVRRAQLWREQGLRALASAVTENEADWLSIYPEMTRRVRHDPEFRRLWEARGAPADAAMIETIERGRREGTIRTDLELDAIAQFLATVFDGLLLETRMFHLPDHAHDVVGLVEDALRPR
jgi:TetR/AcrR family transcriptional regulator, transcriptional repressor of aconitase